jgi:hypothetical protein
MRPRVVRVHIRELVLEDVAPGDRYRVGDALQHELTRLFAEQGVPSPMASAATLDAGSFRFGGARTMGPLAAQAIFGGLKK